VVENPIKPKKQIQPKKKKPQKLFSTTETKRLFVGQDARPLEIE
jgi:hypothetical protein